MQILQWLGAELPYSMVVGNFDDRGKEPICDLQLISKDGKTVVHYTNSAEQFAMDKSFGFSVYLVKMQLDAPPEATKGSQYLLRFNTEKNIPAVWQFVVGTDLTDRGRGLSPANPGYPALVYRNEGGLAGGGTAFKLGEATSVAEMWKEIAQPPYLIPYRGTIATGVQVLSFKSGPAQSKTVGDSISNGAGETFQVAKTRDTVTMTNSVFATATSYTMDNNAVSHVTFGPVRAKGGETMSLEMTPALAGEGTSSFDIVVGKKNKSHPECFRFPQ